MNPAIEAIEQVSRTWMLTQDALAVVRREVVKQSKDTTRTSRLLARTSFDECALSDAEIDIAACQQATQDFAILSMWAVFERRLISRLEEECQKMQGTQASEFNSLVFKKIANTVEYWRIDEALDLIKPLVGADLAGQAKSIKKYRDWVAHRNPRKPTPAKVDPQSARELLKLIAAALDAV